MGYTDNDSMVRVDRFRRDSGKWYDTFALHWDRYRTNRGDDYEDIKTTLKRCIKEQYPEMDIDGFIFVCLKPYHEHSHPLMWLGF